VGYFLPSIFHWLQAAVILSGFSLLIFAVVYAVWGHYGRIGNPKDDILKFTPQHFFQFADQNRILKSSVANFAFENLIPAKSDNLYQRERKRFF
jgi:hypothetical protein